MAQTDRVPELKRELGALLASIVSGYNGDDIAALLGTDRARIGDLRRGNLKRFSLESLIRFVERVGYTVELQVTRRSFAPRDLL